eukprot:scaffold338_cov377-Prasinococcus_capsulatus_cf.AAC.16
MSHRDWAGAAAVPASDTTAVHTAVPRLSRLAPYPEGVRPLPVSIPNSWLRRASARGRSEAASEEKGGERTNERATARRPNSGGAVAERHASYRLSTSRWWRGRLVAGAYKGDAPRRGWPSVSGRGSGKSGGGAAQSACRAGRGGGTGMGVEGLNKFSQTNFPTAFKVHRQQATDHLYIDLNEILHNGR